MAKIDTNAAFAKSAGDMKALINDSDLGRMQYDEAARVIWMTSKTDVVGLGKVLGLTAAIPTEEGMLMIHGYALESDFHNRVQIFRDVATSMTIDPGLAYKPRKSDTPPGKTSRTFAFNWGSVATKALLGALIAGLIAWIVGLSRKKEQD